MRRISHRRAKKVKPKKPKKPKKKKMQAFILTRDSITAPGQYVVIGVYTTLAAAEAKRDTIIADYLAFKNAERDTAYAAGEPCDALLVYADLLPLARITEVTVNA